MQKYKKNKECDNKKRVLLDLTKQILKNLQSITLSLYIPYGFHRQRVDFQKAVFYLVKGYL